MPKLTETIVRELQVPDTGERTMWDTELRGLAARVQRGGVKAFILKYRTAEGGQRKLTLGRWPNVSVAEARKLAKIALGKIARGEDPSADKAAARVVKLTLEAFSGPWLDRIRKTKRPSTIRSYGDLVAQYILPAFGKAALAAVTRSDVETLHSKMKDTPRQANLALAVISSMFGAAIKDGHRLDNNPAKGIARYEENRRTRWLQPDELARLLPALEANPSRTAKALRLLLLTGARRGEVLGMRWEDLDLSRRTWTRPATATKSRKLHMIPLSDPAVAILRELEAERVSSWVFPGERDHNQPLGEIRATWFSACRQAGIEGVRIHDLRHTHASILVSSGVSLPVIGQLLGHSRPETTGRYAHLADAPLRAASDRLAEILAGV